MVTVCGGVPPDQSVWPTLVELKTSLYPSMAVHALPPLSLVAAIGFTSCSMACGCVGRGVRFRFGVQLFPTFVIVSIIAGSNVPFVVGGQLSTKLQYPGSRLARWVRMLAAVMYVPPPVQNQEPLDWETMHCS